MNKKAKTYKVKEKDAGKRLDVFLVEQLSLSRSKVKKMSDAHLFLINNREPRKAGDTLRTGDMVSVKNATSSADVLSLKGNKGPKSKDPKIKVIAEAKDYVVIDKPHGLLVHPTEAGESSTLTSWLVKKYPEIKKVGDNPDQRPGIVHRLDKEASGLLVVARNQKMFDCLKRQFQERTIEKMYCVLVYGNVKTDHGFIDFDIDRGKDGKMVSRPKIDKLKVKNVLKIQEGKEALTEFFVVKRFKRFTLLEIKIHTGRTHQIRVHMFAFNHPVVGDMLYYNKKLTKKGDRALDRLFLHAEKLGFDDVQGVRVHFESPISYDLNSFLNELV
ncbi:MAG: RluA family pseudouridine synthase [Candidatus Magasanikbacteria bacterium]